MTATEQLAKMVRGALQNAIQTHGPITQRNLDSAVKRVVCQLRAEAGPSEEEEHLECRLALEVLQRRFRQLRHGHERTLTELSRVKQARTGREPVPSPPGC